MSILSKAKITSSGPNFRHAIRAGHFDLTTDEPEALGGKGQGPAPFDLYLASLAACTAITARMYANRKGWDLGEFRAELILRRNDAGVLQVQRTLHTNQPLSDEQWTRLLEIVERSPVTLAMRNGADIVSARGI